MIVHVWVVIMMANLRILTAKTQDHVEACHVSYMPQHHSLCIIRRPCLHENEHPYIQGMQLQFVAQMFLIEHVHIFVAQADAPSVVCYLELWLRG